MTTDFQWNARDTIIIVSSSSLLFHRCKAVENCKHLLDILISVSMIQEKEREIIEYHAFYTKLLNRTHTQTHFDSESLMKNDL